jgi:preprotein translocase subunit SecD
LLAQQKQQLEVEVAELQKQVQELEQYRQEMNQFLLAAEPKRQQVETGSKTLQAAIQQLQTQVSALHGELNQLETQIIDRRGQKEELEQELATLQGQKQQFQGAVVESVVPEVDQNGRRNEVPVQTSNSGIGSSLSLPSFPKLGTTGQPVVSESGKASKSKAAQDLPEEWVEFMSQVPEHELQVLKAIVEHKNPAPILKKIAEANLTMPELLIDSINERALETIGDIIVESGSGSNAVIAKEHQKAVKKLISASEYMAG